jgi:hypothetical protein
LTGTVAMGVVATQNFYTIDRLLEARPHPVFNTIIDDLGGGRTRELLRYLSSELNRLYFQVWNLVQIAVGLMVLWLVVKLPGGQKVRWYVVAMLGIVLFLTALITPQVVSVGRSLDFVSREPPPPGLRTFGLLHTAYTVLDAIKLILGILTLRCVQSGKIQV